MLLPMLSIYQEYVRNHHYSLQVLTECKQTAPFAALLARLENKPACQGRSLETFLTYPMHQVCASTVLLYGWAQFTFSSSALISVTNFTGQILFEKLSYPQVFRQFAPLPLLFRRFRNITKRDRYLYHTWNKSAHNGRFFKTCSLGIFRKSLDKIQSFIKI